MGWGRFGFGSFDDDQPIQSWMDDQNDQVAQREALEAAGRDNWEASTRSGDYLDARRTTDVVALGRNPPTVSRESDGESIEGRGVTTVPAGGPSVRYVKARLGDDITSVAGSGDPVDVDAFARLNAVAGRNSTIAAGRVYAIPTADGVSAPHAEALGEEPLRRDTVRKGTLRRRCVVNGQLQRRLNAGQNLQSGSPVAFNSSMGRPQAQPPFPPSQRPPWWEKAAKGGVGAGAYAAGTVLGAPKAVMDAVGDLKDAGLFGLEWAGAFGPQAEAQAHRETKDAARNAVGYVRNAINDPSRVVSDMRAVAGHALDNMSPFNVDLSGSLGEVTEHQFKHGLNFGEAATNMAGMVAGGEVAQGLRAARMFEATKPARIAKLIEEGANPRLAEYMAQPYKGRSHHSIISQRLAKKSNLPSWLVDNPFNLAEPRGMSRSDFYKYHYQVDPKAGGFRLPADLNGGKGWRPKELGLTKYDLPKRIWKGMPVSLKDAMAAVPFADAPTFYYELETRQ